MSHGKKSINLWRSGIYNIGLGFLIILFPVILLRNFTYALFYLLLVSTLSSINCINVYKKTLSFTFSMPFINPEDTRSEKFPTKKYERKEFSILKSIFILAVSVIVYYIVCVLFGAPVFEAYVATLYFSSIMTMLTIYPLLWYLFSSDSIIAVLKVFSDSKCDNLIEIHLQQLIICTIVGAWLGAIPIPLDWDRPWQTWPITCCIGSVLGYCFGHFLIGMRLLYMFYKEKKKMYNRSV
ncbi:phosphatidylinositol-glycan biosynthesis class F protein-like isoform X1 [Stegodyphus dumicola]|uniref:phosphatidylinositol-glycan biosynthesis class F protein-like isoform X1 n=1 Tax=Stegodyphus dumicola TaxID=202533 RepID=UPI0015B2684C|nr:phosphatidylinositol-glycan biosynthesis class F protein-like isoform X1 [Stegodyphus dumicola]